MNNLKTLFGTFLVLFYVSLNAQETEGFISLQSGGELPKDFTELSTIKYNKEVALNTNGDLDEAFFLESRFLIDKLLLGGRVLFNEPCSDYVNAVADYVLQTKLDLRASLRFYVLKSNVPNAFSTDQGIIFITTALIASLENEAQLAFILAHEISHYTEKHLRNSYVDNEDVKKGTGKYEQSNLDSRIEKLSQYSKNHELEADSLGIELYLETEYSYEQIFETFGALLYSYLPYEDLTLNSTFLNTEFMYIPGELFNTEVKEIAKVENYDDQNATHPNIEKRIDAAFDVLNGRESKGDLNYKVSESEFEGVKELVRLEQINLLLSKRSYARALYCVYIMEKTSDESHFLTLSKVKALYGLAKYKNGNRSKEVFEPYATSEGEISVLHYFIGNLDKKELTIIAYRHAFDACKAYNEPVFEDYENDLLKELALHCDLREDEFQPETYEDHFFKTKVNTLLFDVQDSIKKIELSDLTKYDKIRLKKELNKIGKEVVYSPDDFHLFAFSDLVGKGDFQDRIDLFRIQDKAVKEKNILTHENMTSGFSLGWDRVVIVDPSFERIGRNNERLFIDSEQSKIDLATIYTKEYKHLDLERSILDSKQLRSADVLKYNNLGVLYQWVMEALEHQGMDMITSCYHRMDNVVEEYECEYFLFTGIYAREKEFLFFKSSYMEFTGFAMNAKTEKLEFIHINHARVKHGSIEMEAYIFNMLNELNR